MEYLSGAAMYTYTLAKELEKEHDVEVLSRWGKYFQDLNRITWANGEYDLAIISQRDFPIPKAKKVINVVHSHYECETPIIGLDYYVAVKPKVKEHLIKEHSISEDKIHLIYLMTNPERFKPIPKTKRDYTKVVIPATRDNLRQKFFDYYAERANKDFRVFIYGQDFGAKIEETEYLKVHDEIENIKDEIGDSDLVAGILLGTVNLEARAMDVMSRIHDPENPEKFEEFYPPRDEFERDFDVKNTAKKFLKIVGY